MPTERATAVTAAPPAVPVPVAGALLDGAEGLQERAQNAQLARARVFAARARKSKTVAAVERLHRWRAAAAERAKKDGFDEWLWLIDDIHETLCELMAQSSLDGRPAAEMTSAMAGAWMRAMLTGGRKIYRPGGIGRRQWHQCDAGLLTTAARAHVAEDERGRWPALGMLLARIAPAPEDNDPYAPPKIAYAPPPPSAADLAAAARMKALMAEGLGRAAAARRAVAEIRREGDNAAQQK